MVSFFKSIKFKLTLWYSAVLLIISITFILSINILISHYYQSDDVDELVRPFLIQRHIPEELRQLTYENRQLILETREEDLKTIQEMSAFSIIPLIFLSVSGGYIIADQMLNPLKKLNSMMSIITAENLNKRINYQGPDDEIGDLIQNFNCMITRLDENFEAQKQFIQNASHELKTPLASIKLNLDTVLSDKKLSKKELIKLLQNADSSVTHMSTLIDDLLLLSLLNQQISMKISDAVAITDDAVGQVHFVIDARNATASTEHKEKSLMIRANPTLLARSIANIVENAAKYSPKGSTITITTRSTKQSAIITISDEGPGIPKKEQKRIFDRFYRIDTSRSRKTGGTGLGLSIAKDVVERHRGKISLKSSRKGSTFTVTLPLFSQSSSRKNK